MQYYNKLMCVTYEELVPSLMAYETLKSLCKRGKAQRAQRGGGYDGKALIVYNSLPERYRMLFESKYGNPEEVIRKAMMKDRVTIDTAAREYYEAYEYELNGVRTHLSSRLVEDYTMNASVVNELVKMMSERNALRASLGKGMGAVWETIMETSEQLRAQYCHTLPKNLARLRDKINEYRKIGYAALISGKLGNSNTLKITDEAGALIIALKRSRVPVYTDKQLFDRYNELAEEKGWKPLRSLSGLKAWLNSPAVEPRWYDAVFGELASRQRYGIKFTTALPSQRDSLWYSDGTKLNLYYRDADGKVCTTSVYEVIDSYSEVVLGYYISDKEDYEAQYHAYRMAIQKSGHRPYEIVYDNQGGHKKLESQGFLSKIARVHRSTMPYHGQSKTIENIFGRQQQQVLHKDWRFTGQNITARKSTSRPNLEFIDANKDHLYTLRELKDAFGKAIDEWNAMAHPKTGERRIDMYEQSTNAETQPISVSDMVDIFWLMTDKPCRFTDQGLQVTIKGKSYMFMVYGEDGLVDRAWTSRHLYEQFFVRYDPYDFGKVILYSKDKAGELRRERVAKTKLIVHRALQEQEAGEAEMIRKELAANQRDRVERQVQAAEVEYAHGVAPEQHGLKSPELKAISKEDKELIAERVRKYQRGELVADAGVVAMESAKKKVVSIDIGAWNKETSNEDWDAVIAGKL